MMDDLNESLKVVPLEKRKPISRGEMVRLTSNQNLKWMPPEEIRDNLGESFVDKAIKSLVYAKKVRYDDLIATQPAVFTDIVERYMNEKKFDRRGIVAMEDQSKLYILDGHHRLEADLLLGNESGIITVIPATDKSLRR